MKFIFLVILFLATIAQAQVGVGVGLGQTSVKNSSIPGMTGQIIGNGQTVATGVTRYLGFSSGGQPWNSTESVVRQVMPINATFSALRVCLSATSNTGSRAFTLRKNGADTLLATTITNATCSANSTNSFTVSAGDTVAIKQVTTGTLDATRNMWAIKVVASNLKEYPLLMSTFGQVGAAATKYYDLQGNFGGQFTEQYIQYIFPTNGTVDRMFVSLDTPAVTSTLVSTFRKNGADTLLATTVAAGNSTQNNVADVVTVSAGDIATIKIVNNGSAAVRVAVGLRFRPTIDGEGIAGYNSNSNLSQATTQYSTTMGGGTVLDSTEVNVKQLVLAGTMKKLRAATYDNVGGSGQTMITKSRLNGADSTLTCTINSGVKACTDGASTVTLANDDMVDFSYTNSATTGSSQPYGALVLTTTP